MQAVPVRGGFSFARSQPRKASYNALRPSPEEFHAGRTRGAQNAPQAATQPSKATPRPNLDGVIFVHLRFKAPSRLYNAFRSAHGNFLAHTARGRKKAVSGRLARFCAPLSFIP